MFEDEVNARWDALVEAGAVVPRGVKYTFDLDKLKVVDVELYKAYTAEMHGELLNMQMQGLVDIDFEGEDWTIALTEKGRRIAEAIEEALGE